MGYANKFLQSEIGTDGQGYIVVGSGEKCFITPRHGTFWRPAYYEDEGGSKNPHIIVNPTDAGNVFLCHSTCAKGSMDQVACYGVGAGFALVQNGAPEFSLDKDVVEHRIFDKAIMRSIGRRDLETLDRQFMTDEIKHDGNLPIEFARRLAG